MPDKRYLKTLGFNNGQPYYVPEKLSELTDDVGYALTEDIPTQVSELENDADYLVPEDIEGKANVSGNYDDIVSGSAEQLLSSIYTPNTTPYLYRPTPADSDRERVRRLEGLSVGWNQLIDNADFKENTTVTKNGITVEYSPTAHTFTLKAGGTATSATPFYLTNPSISIPEGHKVLIIGIPGSFLPNTEWFINVVNSGGSNQFYKDMIREVIVGSTSQNFINIFVRSGFSVVSDIVIKPQCIDLTTLFGSTIADHIYTLEQATEGSGVAWVKQYIDLDSYHAYSAPTIKSVEGLVSHDMVGFNCWDEEWEAGNIDSSGQPSPYSQYFRTKNFIPVISGANYYQYSETDDLIYRYFYDANKSYIGTFQSSKNFTFTVPVGACFMKFVNTDRKTYNHDICINLSDPSRNGTYEPYEKHSYPLDSTITLRGIPKLVDGKLVADGDWYEPDGKHTVRYGIVDLGSEDWYSYTSEGVTYFYTQAIRYLAKRPLSQADKANIICKYVTGTYVDIVTLDKYVWLYTNGNLCIKDTSYSDVELFKSSLSGSYLVYELDTPTTSTASPYSEVQICESGGTEEFVTDSVVPVGNVTEYMFDIRGQVEKLKAPTTDGTYKYQCTVVNGKPTYAWVSES